MPAGPQSVGARRLIFAGASLLTLASIAFALQLYRSRRAAAVQRAVPRRHDRARPGAGLFDPAGAPRQFARGDPVVRLAAGRRQFRARRLHRHPLPGAVRGHDVAADRRLDRRLHHRAAGDRGAAPHRRPRAHIHRSGVSCFTRRSANTCRARSPACRSACRSSPSIWCGIRAACSACRCWWRRPSSSPSSFSAISCSPPAARPSSPTSP